MVEFRARDLLAHVMQGHLRLAARILGEMKSWSTGDPTYGFQIASLAVFLAGLDKTLSFACILLHLGGLLDGSWLLARGKSKIRPGYLRCDRGLAAKIKKLTELRALSADLEAWVEARNMYMHEFTGFAGYAIGADEACSTMTLLADGPTFSYSEPPLMPIRQKELEDCAEAILDQLGSFLDSRTNLRETMLAARRYLSTLPRDPKRESAKIMATDDLDAHGEVLDALNAEHVGAQWDKLLAAIRPDLPRTGQGAAQGHGLA
jgi:hypothetical protein